MREINVISLIERITKTYENILYNLLLKQG